MLIIDRCEILHLFSLWPIFAHQNDIMALWLLLYKLNNQILCSIVSN